MRVVSLSLLTILLLAFSVPALAGSILFANGPSNGTVGAYFIDGANEVSDSFSVAPNTTATSLTFAEWIPVGGATPLGLNLSVGTSPFGSDLVFETPAISATLLCTGGSVFNGGICGGGREYDVYLATVSLGNLYLNIGGSGQATYWVTLSNAFDSFGGRDGWDINNGPSHAFDDCSENPCNASLQGQVPSESFTIYGSNSTTPEPSGIILFGSGVLGLAGTVRRLRW